MTAAVTRKGERRRYALVAAAADLLREGGFDAVRHRAVADRAGLPLASTTYYFASLEELVAQAVEHLSAIESAKLRERVESLPRRRRGAEAASDLLVELLAADSTREDTISRYERYIACARNPALRGVEQRMLRQRIDAVAEAMSRSGRRARVAMMRALLYTVDGAVASVLAGDQGDGVDDGGGDGSRDYVRATLVDVIDVLAPFDERL